jgi:hypothetical protein
VIRTISQPAIRLGWWPQPADDGAEINEQLERDRPREEGESVGGPCPAMGSTSPSSRSRSQVDGLGKADTVRSDGIATTVTFDGYE